VLAAYLKDEVNAYALRSDGTYHKLAARGRAGFDAQAHFVGRLPAA